MTFTAAQGHVRRVWNYWSFFSAQAIERSSKVRNSQEMRRSMVSLVMKNKPIYLEWSYQTTIWMNLLFLIISDTSRLPRHPVT